LNFVHRPRLQHQQNRSAPPEQRALAFERALHRFGQKTQGHIAHVPAVPLVVQLEAIHHEDHGAGGGLQRAGLGQGRFGGEPAAQTRDRIARGRIGMIVRPDFSGLPDFGDALGQIRLALLESRRVGRRTHLFGDLL
jgi:hypothetical protein